MRIFLCLLSLAPHTLCREALSNASAQEAPSSGHGTISLLRKLAKPGARAQLGFLATSHRIEAIRKAWAALERLLGPAGSGAEAVQRGTALLYAAGLTGAEGGKLQEIPLQALTLTLI